MVMSIAPSIYHHYKRIRTLQTHEIKALPIVIIMPHSACNCRCAMCDIWKDNKNLKQLTEQDISGLLEGLRKLGTRQVLMSGGEALLNPNFFRFCQMLKERGISISLLTTGLTLKQNAEKLVEYVQEIIVSLDGDEATHDRIRNVPHAFQKLVEGIQRIKCLSPLFPISARSVIHKLNFRQWPVIIASAKEMGIDRISFLPADVSSHAFNRQVLWDEKRQHEILPAEEELKEMKEVLIHLFAFNQEDFESGFIAESKEKLQRIHDYYAAIYGHGPFPYKRCNAPWVSTVIEADGTVRPCFFHEPIGNIRGQDLGQILNSEKSIDFRRQLDMEKNSTCIKCVCYLHLSPGTKLN